MNYSDKSCGGGDKNSTNHLLARQERSVLPTTQVQLHYLSGAEIEEMLSQMIDQDQLMLVMQPWRCAKRLLEVADLSLPTIILYDLTMVNEGVEWLLDEVSKIGRSAAVIVLGNELSGVQVATLFKRGVVDYLNYPLPKHRLKEAIIRARMVTTDRSKLRFIHELYQQLTPKEQEVACELMQGNINKIIADNLDISVRTVEVRRSQIMKKMQSSHSVELIQKLLLVQLWVDYAPR